MKILLALCIFLLFLSGCMSEGAVLTSAISARDFNTRLGNMMTDLNARELAEISSMVINAHRNDFVDIDGWYTDHDVLNREILAKKTLLDSRVVRIRLSLTDEGRVFSVEYSFDETTLGDFYEYIKFDVGFGLGSDLELVRHNWETREHEVIDIDDAIDVVNQALADNEDISLDFTWVFVNNNGDDAVLTFNFRYYYTIVGDFFFTTTSISHN